MYMAQMHKTLNGRNPVFAAEYFVKHNRIDLPPKTVSEVVAELVEAKEADGVSDVYIKDLKGRLGRFAEEFTGQISMVTTGEVGRFLRELKIEERLLGGTTRPTTASAKTRNNYRGMTLGYLPKGQVDIESIAVAKEKGGDIEIYRPEELTRILAAAEENLIPFLVIGAFAGLRHAEIQRLD